jgi:2-succinyl-5-enolpyruvyl-6-hydroxy-3-cyclohexene-1-carboxylate synthase
MFSIVDERSAGFFALGLGKASGRPAAVICTSGTAAANLYPAVIEASQGEVPLLVLTADRPVWLRDTDGNQAMDQVRLFGTFPRAFFEVDFPRLEGPSLRHLRALAGRAVALASGPPRGPVHLNFPFEKPLEPSPEMKDLLADFQREHPRAGGGREGGEPYVRVSARHPTLVAGEVTWLREALEGAVRGVIVAGPVPNPGEVAPSVFALGAAAGFPILADPLSGARFSRPGDARVVGGCDLFLRSESARVALKPDLILRVGGSPTSAALLDFLTEHRNVRQIVVDEGHRWKDHLAAATDYLRVSPALLRGGLAAEIRGRVDPAWMGLWAEAEARTRQVLDDLGPGELLEGEILNAVVTGLPEGANLLVASSMPIRDLDAFGFPGPTALKLFGNRGVSGIDGLVSTTLGIAVGSGEETGPFPTPTVGVLGDLAFFHDMNGLLALKSLRPWVVFVVVNNDGGGIFQTLPVRDHEPAFSRFFTTSHGLDFERVADLYDIPFSRSDSLVGFCEAFRRSLATGAPSILEVRTRREATHDRRREVVSAVVAAMEGLGSREGR